jgi:ankyrin repeat protein
LVIKELITKEADVDAVDYSELTALHQAAKNGCLNNVELLLRFNANVNARDNAGLTTLKHAEMKEHNMS